MTVIDRHVLWEWLKVLGLMIAATLGLLVLEDMLRNFGEFIQWGASLLDLCYYYVVLIPSGVPVVLPISVLVSLLYALGQLHRNNELTAMRVAGLGVWRITRSVWAFGVVLAAITWYLNASVIPWSVEQSRRVRESIRSSDEARRTSADQVAIVRAVAFDNPRAGRLWFMNRYSEFTQRGYGVTLGLLDAQRREVRRLLAQEAFFDAGRRSWVFLRGREISFDPAQGEMTATQAFDRHVETGADDDPHLMLLLRKNPDDLSLFELRRLVHHLRADGDPRAVLYAMDYERAKASPLGVLLVMAIAIPFAVSGVRVNPAVGVSKSIGLFFAFYLLTTLATLLGERGQLDPLVAAWLPDVAMMAVAFWFFRKVL